ncbi:arsenate reductase (glutaredoxin) [Proteus vulgaris]|uniref:arsenate reductase (glutaredoxin) n=1 Tax=Proteus vulgaris TaxID=585 RepID=UPI0018CF3A1E|nr:arsenate reductase (glutaredoxin) [Proteus vulgaris]QPN88024.1 arsenate reductase (glutaredoxin) [Proteus vulgaris]
MNEITIYHNPNCGTSRNTLAMIRNSGVEPTIIHYLETPPTKDVLVQLIADMKITVSELLRKNVEPYEQLNLENNLYSDEQLIGFMLQYPILINRPIVVTPLGVKLCRPSEIVLDILPNQQQSEFIKEDGQIVIGSHDVKIQMKRPVKHKP